MSKHTPGLDIEDIADGAEHRLLLSGELEIASVPTLEGAVRRVCAVGATAVTLDLSQLMFIDSTGLAAIIFTGRVCEKHGCDFSLLRGPRSIQRLFELTGLLDVLPFRDPDTDEAELGGADAA